MLLIDGLGGLASGLFGTTNVTTFVESGVGIASGARTGLCAIVCGCLMGSAIFLLPVIGRIPATAAIGALLYVGVLFIPRGNGRKLFTRSEMAVTVIMVAIVVVTLSLSIAFAVSL